MTGLRRALLWIWPSVIAGLSVAIFVLAGYVTQGFGNALSASLWLLLPVIFTGLGAVILNRDPGNRIAWILLVVGFALLVDDAVQPLVVAPPSPSQIDNLALFLANSTWVFIFFPLFLLLYVFPTGRLLSRRWAWAAWLTGAMVVGFFALPEAVWNGAFNVVWGVGLFALPIGGFVSLVVRFRRSEPVERAQIKWMLFAGLIFALAYVAGVVATEVFAADFGDLLIGDLFALALVLLPASMTAAITRYHLFDIDRLISRTLAYTLVVTALGALYFGGVTLVTNLLPAQNALAVAGSTLAVAAVFNPLRRATQRWVDRRFNRAAYTAEAISYRFSGELRRSLNSDELAKLWISTVVECLQPTASAVWLSGRHSEESRA